VLLTSRQSASDDVPLRAGYSRRRIGLYQGRGGLLRSLLSGSACPGFAAGRFARFVRGVALVM
jgi:hypothetical protein